MTRWSAVLLLLTAAAPAAPPPPTPLDPETAAPYQWRVVVRFDPSPYLPPDFRRRLTADIKAALQPALGELARVEVTDLATIPADQRDGLVKAFAEKGWPALDSEEFRRLTGVKTHFLRVTATAAGVRLEARQHDGSTGLASPAVRTQETRSPDTVSRLAGLMIGREFGPVGTLERIPGEAEAVRVRFRGDSLPGFDRQVKEGDVFAVSVIRELPRARPAYGSPKRSEPEPPPVRAGQPRQYTLLQADRPLGDGSWRCRLLSGLADPLPYARGVVGFRCLKLATVEGPVRLKVVDADGAPPAAGQLLQARASDLTFPTRPDPRDALELRDGVFRSPRPLKNVACVVVGLGAGREWRFPVPVLGDGTVTVKVDLKPEDAVRAAFERDCQDLRGRVAEARTAHGVLIDTLSKLILSGKNKEALERAAAGLANLDAADKELSAELDRLKKSPGAKDPIPAALLAASAEQLEVVRAGRAGVEKKVEELKEAVARQADPVRFEKEFRAKELESRIRTLIDAGEIPEALDLYDQLYEVTQNEAAKKQKAKLAAEWEPKGPAHKAAREFVMGRWRQASSLADFQEAIDPLKAAAEELVKNADRLGLRNLLASMEPAYAKLKDILDTLDENTDRATVKRVQELSQAVKGVEDQAREALKKIEGAKKE